MATSQLVMVHCIFVKSMGEDHLAQCVRCASISVVYKSGDGLIDEALINRHTQT